MTTNIFPQQPFIYSPTAQYLFNRSYSVALAPPKTPTALQYGNIGPKAAPLRVRFEIEKTMYGASPNHSKIEIYNMAIQTYQSLKTGYLVNLQAGYSNIKVVPQNQSLVGTIFTGNIFLSHTSRSGAETITSLECLDGGAAITYARLDKSYPAGTNIAMILQDCATAMSVTNNSNPSGISAGIALGIPNVIYNKGFMAQGPCKNTLDKVLNPLGLQWTVQDGNLNILPKLNTDGASAIVISPSTGMIGVPSNNQFYTQFTCLLNPKVVPGCVVQLISENTSLNGFYKVLRAKYEGDTHDNKWQVSCEATLLKNVQQNLKLSTGFDYDTALVQA